MTAPTESKAQAKASGVSVSVGEILEWVNEAGTTYFNPIHEDAVRGSIRAIISRYGKQFLEERDGKND